MGEVVDFLGDGVRAATGIDLGGQATTQASNSGIQALLDQQRQRQASSFLNAEGGLRDSAKLSGRDFFGREQLQNLANFDQTSPIAQRLLEQQGAQNTQARNNLNAQAQSGFRNTLSTIASRGGLDSGARARLAASNQRNLLNANQGLRTQEINARNQILTDDANRSVNTLGQLAGFDRADQRQDFQTRLQELQLNRQADAQTQQAISQLQQQRDNTGFFGK